MSVNITQVPQDSTTGESTDPLGYTSTFDGQTFFWGPNQKRAFSDDGVAEGHQANAKPAAALIEDDEDSGKHYPNRHPGRA